MPPRPEVWHSNVLQWPAPTIISHNGRSHNGNQAKEGGATRQAGREAMAGKDSHPPKVSWLKKLPFYMNTEAGRTKEKIAVHSRCPVFSASYRAFS
eukprot:1158139-Pelagomonas_calceolata.AAC.12